MDQSKDTGFTLRVRQTNGVVIEQEISGKDVSIGELKQLLSERTEIPVDRMRLMLGSDILNDARSLESYNITDSSSVLRLVQLAGGQSNHPRDVTGIAAAGAPPPALDPQFNQARQMFSISPQLAQTLMMANPQMREAMENNPELRNLIRDPQIMQQSLEAVQNPQLMQEVKRNNDRVLSNLELAPGGYAHIRRMYHNIQEPLNRAAEDRALVPLEELNQRRARILGVTKPDASKINTTPLPNPWARNRSRSSSRPAMDTRSPFAMFDSVSHNADRLARLDISANQLSSRDSGRGRSQVQQAQARSQLGDIPFLASLLQGSSDRLSGNGASSSTAANAPAMPQSDSQRPTQMSATSLVNPAYAGSTNSTSNNRLADTGFSTGSEGTMSQSLLDESRARFRDELEQLEEMGFSDRDKNLQALIQTDGDLALALNIIADESDD